jgi:hypothetical protein
MLKHPEVTVELTGHNGNSFAILSAVDKALRQAGVSREERELFFKEATASDYDSLLQTCMKWVDIT